MSATSVHFPKGLLERLARKAKERRVTRNRLIVEACEAALGEHSTWPADLVDRKDTAELRKSFPDWVRTIDKARRSKRKAPF